MSNISPEKIFQVGLGFWASKTLLSAVEIGLFTELAKAPLTASEVASHLGLHQRGVRDFLDALVSMGFLNREDGMYSNTLETGVFLDSNQPSYIGGLLEMSNARLYGFWGALTEALRTGQPQNESKTGGSLFEGLYADQERLKAFAKAMTAISMGAAIAIAAKFPWKSYQTFLDVGAAQGGVPVEIARRHEHLKGTGLDLPQLKPIFEEYVTTAGLQDRLSFQSVDFFNDPLPNTDVVIYGHILHDWSLEEKKLLLRKAYDAISDGGAVIIHEAIIDDDRSKNTFGLLMSLNMLIETPAGFDYTASECFEWLREAGFRDMHAEHLVGPDSMIVAIK